MLDFKFYLSCDFCQKFLIHVPFLKSCVKISCRNIDLSYKTSSRRVSAEKIKRCPSHLLRCFHLENKCKGIGVFITTFAAKFFIFKNLFES